MHVVYDPSHVLHDPTTEVQHGVAMPMYEVPAPFAAALESEWLPSRGRISDHVLRLLGRPSAGDDVRPVGGGREQRPA